MISLFLFPIYFDFLFNLLTKALPSLAVRSIVRAFLSVGFFALTFLGDFLTFFTIFFDVPL
jgi:hypothetical protein